MRASPAGPADPVSAPGAAGVAESAACGGAAAPAAAAITLKQVWLARQGRVIVRDLDGVFTQGSLAAIVGPNGAGKSTLVDALAGRLMPVHGQILLHESVQGQLACLPQRGTLDRGVPIRTFDLVALGAWHRLGPWRGLSPADHDAVEAALQAVGLAGQGRQPIATLSGGQLQRALFARLIVRDARVIVLDEPFSAVDRATTEDLLALLQQWHAQGRTLIVVLHDLDMVRTHFPRALLLARQQVAWGPTAEVLTAAHLHLARHLCAGEAA
ncbi:metal ABC transporter ATP-binding protein [Castellaniella sp.]|uniref:metal ABC transporter ATP-binding protein n=1 Tax=Castellaniella sp. TaxID=1955812 RepID=UPI0035695E9A